MAEELGIEYNRYLNEVVEALESDPEFRKKLENASEADIRSGKITVQVEGKLSEDRIFVLYFTSRYVLCYSFLSYTHRYVGINIFTFYCPYVMRKYCNWSIFFPPYSFHFQNEFLRDMVFQFTTFKATSKLGTSYIYLIPDIFSCSR
jgi:hypothetical protein